jgi:hypothetical protein
MKFGDVMRYPSAAALLLGLILSACSGDTVNYALLTAPDAGGTPNPCGDNGVHDALSNTCSCADGYEFCSDAADDFSCCPSGEDVGPDPDTDSNPDTDADGGTDPDTTPVEDTGDNTDVCSEAQLTGVCRGTVLIYCSEGSRREVDCADSGTTCGYDEQLGWNDCLSGTDPTVDPDVSDGCAGLPPDGWCADDNTIAYCTQPTGGGSATISQVPCGASRRCAEAAGAATCEFVDGAVCADGQTRCTGGSVEYCSGGAWLTETCTAGCTMTALGATCKSDGPVSTYTGRITYDARGPNESWTDWGSSEALEAYGLLIVSWSGGEILDATYTGSVGGLGDFSILVPTSPSEDDYLVAITVYADESGRFVFAVADPDLAAGEREPLTHGESPALWMWSWTTDDYPSGSTIHISEDYGSGAIRVYQLLAASVFAAADELGVADPPSLIGWMGTSISWSCGACFVDTPTDQLTGFDSQTWIGMNSDAGYWSDAVTAHEAGHYVMAAYGESDGEGGAHTLGVATNPGQAWSEGWATYYSSAVRFSPTYYDKQGGGFFWLDLDMRRYGGGPAWQRPSAGRGLMQLMDENEVAAMLWRLDGEEGDGLQPLLEALQSPRMTVAPYGRGYTQRLWDDDPADYETTRWSLPFLADFLDALVCDGHATATQVDAVTEPSTHFPYPSWSPICR